jgi:adenylate kinase family enzyme
MQRVAIVGPGGAGKSTLARQLGQMTGLPVIHLDREHWRPSWQAPPDEEWLQTVERLAAGDRWIIDGNYGGTMEARFARADTIVFMDFPRWRYIPRVIRRRFAYREGSRPDMADGCPERLDLGFLRWLWAYPAGSRLRTLEALAPVRETAEVHTLRTPRDVDRFLASVRAASVIRPS